MQYQVQPKSRHTPVAFGFLLLYMAALSTLLWKIGFGISPEEQELLAVFLSTVALVGALHLAISTYQGLRSRKPSALILDGLLVLYSVVALFQELFSGFQGYYSEWIHFAIFVQALRHFSRFRLNYRRSFLNPAQLFIGSFLVLILLGAGLLMLPRATYSGISLIDALFTSTSAVCVTGLIVVDTQAHFTPLGHWLIMALIQVGGLGILTFASYFSFFFKGGATYENQIALSDITSSEKIGEVFTTLRRIIVITFLVELIGAVMIFSTLGDSLKGSWSEKLFFSVFHSISSFCNAGFSTLTLGMADERVLFNYPLQLSIIGIFVFGGLGFPIVINSLRYFKYTLLRLFYRLQGTQYRFKPWILTLSNRLNLSTTLILSLVGTCIILYKEFDNVLKGHSLLGKIVTAVFTATTPRTAGYNSIDFSQLHFSSIIIIIFLMWVGASPASTGGGIKTSTFAIATLNFFSLARGKHKIEIFNRQIADISVQRAFAVMSLSLVVIGMSVFWIAHFDPDLPLLDIAFESFSAYSTVGLSLGITGQLSWQSKLVLIITMFIGRVTMLTILISLFKRARLASYSYPREEILIN